jgi:hypothetical protein
MGRLLRVNRKECYLEPGGNKHSAASRNGEAAILLKLRSILRDGQGTIINRECQ